MPTLVPLRLPATSKKLAIKTAFATTFTSKVDLFGAVESALEEYQQSNSKRNLLALTNALAAWKRSKQGPNFANWANSERRAYVTTLSDWLIKESEAIGIFPTSREGWNGSHNCYAYAMRCLAIDKGGNNSRPGHMAGAAKHKPGEFADGIIEDGRVAGKVIVKLACGIDEMPGPLIGHYLIAMLSSGSGYHFLRRNEHLGLWTHKNGAGGEVETYYYDTVQEKPVALTDQVVKDILHNPGKVGCNNMTFNCYLKVPDGGIKVGGSLSYT